jgi:hypothetical protein
MRSSDVKTTRKRLVNSVYMGTRVRLRKKKLLLTCVNSNELSIKIKLQKSILRISKAPL